MSSHRTVKVVEQSSQVKSLEWSTKGTGDWAVQRDVRAQRHAGQVRGSKVVPHELHSQWDPAGLVRSEAQAMQRAPSIAEG
ncbi:hypothetical protein [Streptomyces microflavus]|uniref:hypothetical protein n=1 Tax=Streptomyces microflavus TaxID=1919 RepID=UPI0036E9F416